MTLPVKPTLQPRWATSAIDPDDIDEPSSGQKDSGWGELQVPPHEHMNWLQNKAYEWTNFLEQFFDTFASNVDIDTGTDFIKLFTAGGEISLLANGNVGIGTDTPDFKLQIEDTKPEAHLKDILNGVTAISQPMSGLWLTSDEMTTNNFTPAIKFGSTGGAFTTFNPKFLAGLVGRATENYGADTDSGMALDFLVTPDNDGASSTPSLGMTLDQNSQLGIGITPIQQLHTRPISGDNFFVMETLLNTDIVAMVFRNGGAERFKLDVISLTDDVRFLSDASDGRNAGFIFFNEALSPTIPLLKLQNDGDIGIGTDTPQEKLHLFDGKMRISALGPTDPYVHFVTDGGTALSWMVGVDDNGNKLSFAFGLPSSSTPFGTAADKFTIDSLGRVGIGITSPTVELHVVGSLRLESSRPVLIPNADNDGMTKQGDAGGWSFGLIGAKGNAGTFLGGLGVLGSADALTHWYIGTTADKRVIIEDNGDMTINGNLDINGLVGNVEINGELFVDDGMRFEASPVHLIKILPLEIGSWNMAGGPISIAHGLAFDDIMAVSVFVRNDANTLKVPIDFNVGTGTGNLEIDATNIIITPLGGFFVAPDWNGTGFNRGFIMIDYIGAF